MYKRLSQHKQQQLFLQFVSTMSTFCPKDFPNQKILIVPFCPIKIETVCPVTVCPLYPSYSPLF